MKAGENQPERYASLGGVYGKFGAFIALFAAEKAFRAIAAPSLPLASPGDAVASRLIFLDFRTTYLDTAY